MQDLLNKLLTLRDGEEARAQACLEEARSLGYKRWRDDPTGTLGAMYKTSKDTIRALDARIAEQRAEIRRAGGDNPFVQAIKAGGGGERSARMEADGWAKRVATQLIARNQQQRAISSGVLDVPSLVPPFVSLMKWPSRLVDLLISRVQIDQNSLEFYQETARVNNAAVVADLAQKPTSTFTLTPVQERARVIAHLSEPIPARYLMDIQQVQPFLSREMAQGVLAKLEQSVVSGDGQNEEMTGILNTAGTTQVAFDTDILTTIRHSFTELQNIGETPDAIVLNPADAETVDLTRWGAQGGLLTSGFDHPSAVVGNSSNFFGPDDQIKRVISPSIPQGTAIIGDFGTAVTLYLRESMSLLLNYWSESLFETNAFIMRAEMRCVIGVLRPKAFAIATLHS
ncbi:phage major capsid protein [Mycobacterium sp. 852002-51057_SCH5723018]|uniref:phage major capsid protein n=1 Tax=Mycobacterium sp. 852002-51057_SCH5723018 TaxID=1834094 RepID=UPI000AE94AA0|nr:phage major capsid protein [Mycobacterium sp. 852002-51057_SCH5723018]